MPMADAIDLGFAGGATAPVAHPRVPHPARPAARRQDADKDAEFYGADDTFTSGRRPKRATKQRKQSALQRQRHLHTGKRPLVRGGPAYATLKRRQRRRRSAAAGGRRSAGANNAAAAAAARADAVSMEDDFFQPAKRAQAPPVKAELRQPASKPSRAAR